MVTMIGGKERFTQHLDSLFTMEIDEKYIAKHEDITRDGIIVNKCMETNLDIISHIYIIGQVTPEKTRTCKNDHGYNVCSNSRWPLWK